MTSREVELRVNLIVKMLLQLTKEINMGKGEEETERLLKKAVEENRANIAKECLKEVGVNRSSKGFDYLVVEVVCRIENPNDKLYYNAAQKYSKTYTRVERCIRTAKMSAFERREGNLFQKLFGKYKEVPSNKEFIAVIADYVEDVYTSAM